MSRGWARGGLVGVPVGHAGHDFRLNVRLDGLPFLGLFGGGGGEQLAEIAGFDVWEDAAVLDGVVVFDDYMESI